MVNEEILSQAKAKENETRYKIFPAWLVGVIIVLFVVVILLAGYNVKEKRILKDANGNTLLDAEGNPQTELVSTKQGFISPTTAGILIVVIGAGLYFYAKSNYSPEPEPLLFYELNEIIALQVPILQAQKLFPMCHKDMWYLMADTRPRRFDGDFRAVDYVIVFNVYPSEYDAFHIKVDPYTGAIDYHVKPLDSARLPDNIWTDYKVVTAPSPMFKKYREGFSNYGQDLFNIEHGGNID